MAQHMASGENYWGRCWELGGGGGGDRETPTGEYCKVQSYKLQYPLFQVKLFNTTVGTPCFQTLNI